MLGCQDNRPFNKQGSQYKIMLTVLRNPITQSSFGLMEELSESNEVYGQHGCC